MKLSDSPRILFLTQLVDFVKQVFALLLVSALNGIDIVVHLQLLNIVQFSKFTTALLTLAIALHRIVLWDYLPDQLYVATICCLYNWAYTSFDLFSRFCYRWDHLIIPTTIATIDLILARINSLISRWRRFRISDILLWAYSLLCLSLLRCRFSLIWPFVAPSTILNVI